MKPLEKNNSSLFALISSDNWIKHDIPAGSVADTFFKSENTDALALLDSDKPVGMITKSKFMYHVMKRYGYDLFKNKPIHYVADMNPLILHIDSPPEVAIQKALERDNSSIYDEIIVIDDSNNFKGLVSVKEMILHQSSSLAGAIVSKEIERERALELEKMNVLKSQFIANVTHELRSPVNTIIGLSELIRISAKNSDTEETIKKLTTLNRSANHLRNVVTNILDLSKIESGKMEVLTEKTEILSLCEEILDSTQVLLGNKPVKIRLENNSKITSLILDTDPVKLKQILINLCSNAAKFTENGNIILSVELTDDKVKISVSDTGCGIRKEDISKLFQAFNQLEDAKTKKHEGTGLGLAIVKSLTRLLKGKLSIRSNYGSGTSFHLYLPYK